MNIEVLLFGILADLAGTERFSVSDIKDTDDLKKKILIKVPDLNSYRYQLTVNKTITRENIKLNDGDEVAFLPPFAGG